MSQELTRHHVQWSIVSQALLGLQPCQFKERLMTRDKSQTMILKMSHGDDARELLIASVLAQYLTWTCAQRRRAVFKVSKFHISFDP